MIRRERDSRGWRVPAPGTKSRMIYDIITRERTRYRKIAAQVGISVASVQILVWRIKNPEVANAVDKDRWEQRKTGATKRPRRPG